MLFFLFKWFIISWKLSLNRIGKQVGKLPPLYIDGKTELIQAHSIMRYTAKEMGFRGDTELEIARADEVVQMIYELRLCAVDNKD